MVVNPGKFQILSLGSNIDNSKIIFMIENHRVKSRSAVKLLVITIDDKLSFTTHVENLCSTSSNLIQTIDKPSLRTIYEMEDANFEDMLRIALGLFMKTIFKHC